MMKIDKDTWHYKLYRKWLELKCFGWTNSYDELYDFDEEDFIEFDKASDKLLHARLGINPNLCLYIKVVLLYMPIRNIKNSKIFQLSLFNLALYGIIYFECVNSEFSEFMFSLGVTLALASIIFLIAVIVVAIFEKIKDYRDRDRPTVEKKPTFYKSIVKPYMKSKKDKICPFLTFE